MAKVIRKLKSESAEFIKTFNTLMTSRAAWEVWADFVSLTAISISNAVDKCHFEAREKEYIRIQSKYTKDEMVIISKLLAITVMALENNPWQDFLGELYMSLDLRNHWKGQFFTPYSITKMMAKLTFGNLEQQISEKGYVSVNDCACGAGATLIAAAEEAHIQLEETKLNWQNHVLFLAQDIDAVTAKMCYIQLSLLGCAGAVKIGNSFTEPMCLGESDENYWYTPMWFSEVWYYRRLWRQIDIMCNSAQQNVSDTIDMARGPYYYYYYEETANETNNV